MGAAKLPEDSEKQAADRLLQTLPMSRALAVIMAQKKGRGVPRVRSYAEKKRIAAKKPKPKKISRADCAIMERRAQADRIEELEKALKAVRLKLDETASALAKAIDRERGHLLLIGKLQSGDRTRLSRR